MKRLIQQFAERLYLSYARAHAPREMLDISDCLAQAVTALIIMPTLPPAQQPTALRLLADFQAAFAETHLTVLIEKNAASRLVAQENLQILTFTPEDLTFYGLPRKALQETVRARHFDLVLDLTERFDLVATCLCLVSDAKLRVALQHPKRDSLYHFQVRVAEHHSLEMKYDSLLKYLTCLKNWSTVPEPELLAV